MFFRRWSNCIGVSKFSKVRLLGFFYARGRLSRELFEIVCSLRFVANFSKKEKKFTNLVGDGMSKLMPIFPMRQGSIRLVWKQYCFGCTCWGVEMLQWFAVLDFVHILSLIQISQMSWSRATEDSKNIKMVIF